jgi:fructosamine-3-kinase
VTLPPGATDARRVAGGDINDAWRVRLPDGTPAFVKTREDPQPGEYETEADGLAWLAAANALRTPHVIEAADEYLVLEWIDAGALDATGEEELGRGLARLHAAGAPQFGGPRPLRIGPLTLPNDSRPTWHEFYAENRLTPLARRLNIDLDPLIARLPRTTEPPARLHGDLWGGNVLAAHDGRPYLIDPAAYGGHREMDIAMLRLFGGASPRVFAAYEEEAPLQPGAQERTELWQLFPLLVHAVLFGGSYVDSVLRLARRYG